MNFQQAVELATDIDAGTKAELLSIGRFLPLAEIQPSSPWGCSVLLPGSPKARVVWSLWEYCQLFQIEQSEISNIQTQISNLNSESSNLKSSIPPRPDAKHRSQPTLF